LSASIVQIVKLKVLLACKFKINVFVYCIIFFLSYNKIQKACSAHYHAQLSSAHYHAHHHAY